MGGHLFAIASDRSESYGFDCEVTGFAANTELEQHYVDNFDAIRIHMLHPYQILITSEAGHKIKEVYTYTYRHIDDADVKRADTERMIEWKKLQMEEERRKNSKTGFFIWLAIVVIMVMVGFIMISTGPKDGDDPCYTNCSFFFSFTHSSKYKFISV